MNSSDFYGAWKMVDTNDTSSENSFSIDNRVYEIVLPDIDILYFVPDTDKCFRLGISNLTEEKKQYFDEDIEFETISYFPGTFDYENYILKIDYEEKIEIIQNGQLHLINDSFQPTLEEWFERLVDNPNDNKLLDYVKNEIVL